MVRLSFKETMPLVGREDETATLSAAIRCVVTGTSPEVCLVHGISGTGKTSLVRDAAARTAKALQRTRAGRARAHRGHSQAHPFHLLSSKFEQQHDFAEPYSAIVTAFDQLADTADADKIRSCLTTEAKILTKLVPSFGQLVSEAEALEKTDGLQLVSEGDAVEGQEKKDTGANNKAEETGNSKSNTDTAILNQAAERLAVAFEAFLRAFCGPSDPVVLFIDDLQWADENSRALLSIIVQNKNIRNLLFIGSYRDEDDHGLPITYEYGEASTTKEGKEEQPEEPSTVPIDLGQDVTVTDIALGPFQVTDVDALIGHIVDMPVKNDDTESVTSSLSELVHARTRGNPYFVVQFLEVLHSRSLFRYNQMTCKWEWASTEEIKAVSSVSDNVVALLQDRIDRLSPDMQHILVIASFLGFVFDDAVLVDLVQEFGTNHFLNISTASNDSGGRPKGPMKSADIEQNLKLLLEEELLEESGNAYRFCHDKIYECVYGLVTDEREKSRLHYQIGLHIWHRHGEDYIFLAAEQLNKGTTTIKSDNERMFVAEMNYKASLAAKEKIGVGTVGLFIERAIENCEALEDKKIQWHRTHDLLISMYTFAAEVEFSLGNFEVMDELIETVLENATEDNEKIRPLTLRARVCGVRREFLKGIDESKKVLSLLGVPMRKSSTLSILIEMTKTKNAFKHMSDEDILNMPEMEDENKKQAMKILQPAAIFGWHSDVTFAGLGYFRMARLTAKHGWCEVTAYAFAGYGFLLASMGQEDEAFRFAELALGSTRTDIARPEVIMMVHAFLAHFQKPVNMSLKPLLAGYRSGLETGDTMCGTICMSVYAHVFFFSGLSLATLAADMRQFAYQLKLCQQDLALAFVIPCEQLALNLSGQTEDPIDVSVESMKRDLEAYHDKVFHETPTSEDVTLSMALYFKAFSAYLFDDLNVAKETIDKLLARKTKRMDGTQILNIFFAFVDGIVSFALIRSKKGKAGKYRSLAKASIKELGRYAKKRSLNVAGLLTLLLAEKASLSEKNPEVLRKKYGEAIRQLTQGGFVHFSAIANELAAKRMIEANDDYWAEFYLIPAAEKYVAWGAVAKARDMKKHYPVVAEKGPNTEKAQVAVDSSHRGSSQFDSNVDSLVGASRFSHIGSLKASTISGSVLGQSSITAGSTNLSASVIAENVTRLSAEKGEPISAFQCKPVQRLET